MTTLHDTPLQLRFDELLPEGCLRSGGLTLPKDYPADRWELLIETSTSCAGVITGGSIRKRERYQAHVGQILRGVTNGR